MDTGSGKTQKLTNLDEANSALLAYMFSGALGSASGKDVTYSLLEEDDTHYSFVAALEDEDEVGKPIDRYRIVIHRMDGEVKRYELITLSEAELADAVLSGSGHHLATFSRFTDGMFSISYKISVKEDTEIEYILQLRYHGDVPSMNALMRLMSSSIEHHILPIPTVYPITDERRQHIRGMGLQITRFIPGTIGSNLYPRMSHKKKLKLLGKLALAFDAVWSVPFPGKRSIGEIKATVTKDNKILLSVGPDRHHSLGGPFASVADYLRAFIRVRLKQFQAQEGIAEYKSQFLERVTAFVKNGMYNVPPVVEQIPVVVLHEDMGLHNIIVSHNDPTSIQAIIDWEFCASAPYASLHLIIESLFRMPAINGFGAEYPCAQELRSAFWSAIPKWEKWNESEATKVFLEWFRFALFMKAEWRPDDISDVEKEVYWAENIRVVENFLAKYHK